MSNEMTDRELLELAAKAAGYHWPLVWPYPSPVDVPHDWNPRTDDGDALRLAVKLGIDVMHTNIHSAKVHAMADYGVEITEDSSIDPPAAARRAIVKAAAEIGRNMK